ncbi:MAG: hypothetical protein AVDCRST_MAG35-2597, partial [uncultured Quadrisphaera sp.]
AGRHRQPRAAVLRPPSDPPARAGADPASGPRAGPRRPACRPRHAAVVLWIAAESAQWWV